MDLGIGISFGICHSSFGFLHVLLQSAAHDLNGRGLTGPDFQGFSALVEQHAEAIGRAAGWKGQVHAIPDLDLPRHLKTSFDWRHDLVGDTSKFRRELGYREPIPFEEGMTKSVAWQRAHPPAAFDSKLFEYVAEEAVLKTSPRRTGIS